MPQNGGLIYGVQDLFYDQICTMTAIVPASAFLTPCGTEAVQAQVTIKYIVTVDMASQTPYIEGERILEYALAYYLLLCNMFPQEM